MGAIPSTTSFGDRRSRGRPGGAGSRGGAESTEHTRTSETESSDGGSYLQADRRRRTSIGVVGQRGAGGSPRVLGMNERPGLLKLKSTQRRGEMQPHPNAY